MLSKLNAVNHSWSEHMLLNLTCCKSSMTKNLSPRNNFSNADNLPPLRRMKMKSCTCNNSTTRLIMKFIWFYVVPKTNFLMPIVRLISNLYCDKKFKSTLPIWLNDYMRTILYYLSVNHIRIIWQLPPDWPRRSLRLYSCFSLESFWTLQVSCCSTASNEGVSPEHLKLPASIAQDPSCALRNWQALSDRISSTTWQ